MCARYYDKKSETPRIAHFMNPAALSNLHRRRSKPTLTKLFASMYILEVENEDLLEIERQIRRGTYKPPEADENIGSSSEVEMVLTLKSNETARIDRAERRKRREKSKIQTEQKESKNPDCECLPIMMRPVYEIEKTTVYCGKKRKRSDDIQVVNSPPKDPRTERPRLDPQQSTYEPETRVPSPVKGTSRGISPEKDKKYEELVFEKILDFSKKESENDLENNSNAVETPIGVAQTEFDRPDCSTTEIPDGILPSNNDFQPFSTELSTPPKISYVSDSYQFNSQLNATIPETITRNSVTTSQFQVFDDKIEDFTPRKGSSRSRIEEFRKLLSQTSPKISEPTPLETGTSGQTVETNNEIEATASLVSGLISIGDSPDYEEIEIIDETHEESDREKSDSENYQENDREKNYHEKLKQSRDSEELEEVTLLETFDELGDEDETQINETAKDSPPEIQDRGPIQDLRNDEEKDDIEITEVRTKFLPGLPSQEDVQSDPIVSAEPIGESLTWKFPVANYEHNLERNSPDIPPVQNRDSDPPSESEDKDADGPGNSVGPDESGPTIDPIRPDLVTKSEYSPASIQSSSSNSSPVESPISQESPESPPSPESSSSSKSSPCPPEFEPEPTSVSPISETNDFETTQEKDRHSSPDCSENTDKRSEDRSRNRSSDTFECPKGGLFGQLMPVRTSPERTTVTSMSENIKASPSLDESDPETPCERGNPVPSDPRRKPPSDSPVLSSDKVHEEPCEEPMAEKTLLVTNQSEPESEKDFEVSPELNRSEPRKIPLSEYRKSRPNSPVIKSASVDKNNDVEKSDKVKSSEKSSISSILREGPSSIAMNEHEDTAVSLSVQEKRRPEPRRIPFHEFRKSRPNSPLPRKQIRTASVSSSTELEELQDENEEEDLKEIIQRSSSRIKHVPIKKKIGNQPPVVKPFVPENDKDSDSDDDLGPVEFLSRNSKYFYFHNKIEHVSK